MYSEKPRGCHLGVFAVSCNQWTKHNHILHTCILLHICLICKQFLLILRLREAAQEVLRAFVLRLAEELLRLAFFGDYTLVDEDNAV